MSGTLRYVSQYGAMAPGDQDDRFESFTADLQPLGDTITGTPVVTIARQDGVAMSAADLSLKSGSVVVDATNLVVYFWLIAGQNTTAYWVYVTVTTAQGRVLTRTGSLTVLPQVG